MPKEKKRARKEARKAGRYEDLGLVDVRGNPVSRSHKPRKQNGGKKKKRPKSKILYFMLLPIPSETELREAQQQLQMGSMP
ncbi:hypothetical protein LTR70_006276 [Exophiala xenobiotica]|uniref:Uncharacterized protein n=1 Tax=Lithohypha guttulata TaxID=1690604 RepID=A0ABR0KIX5_9EURO|nr:hypothetical protein LTR24_002408 [Lithohypha guttulata]KAK5316322.1 hypothetical protein LTR70_006276 [Exophiala xenobiotica]